MCLGRSAGVQYAGGSGAGGRVYGFRGLVGLGFRVAYRRGRWAGNRVAAVQDGGFRGLGV